MDFSTLKTRTALNLGNLQSSDPFYTYLGSWVNSAQRAVVTRTLSKGRRSFNLFRELMEKFSAVTSVNDLRVAVPDECLVVERVYSFDSSAVPDLDDDTVKPVVEIPIHKFDILSRDTSISGYPRLWSRDGDFINVYPTPRTGYTTCLLLRGIGDVNALSDNADEPIIKERWHDAILFYACYLGALELNRVDEAQKWLDACDRHIMQTIDILGLESSSGESVVKIEGDPTRV
jgi:hypothetical protein